MNSFEQEIAEALAATGSFEKEAALKLISVPPDTSHGNFTIPCFSLAKVMRKAPKMIAEDLAAQVKLPAGLSKVEAVNGYLNFFIDRGFLAKSTLEEIAAKGLKYGHAAPNGKVVCIDFSSPNIGKELAFHHLRSTMIGNSLSRIYKAAGYKVERINHLGDWGTAFGKLIVMYLRENRPTDDATLNSLTVKELNILYAAFSKASKEEPGLEDEARAAFTKLEQGDEFYRKLWTAFRAATLKELMRIYDMMGVGFDHYTGESFFEDKIPAILDELREKALHDGKTRPLLELLRGIPEVGASRREVERVHRAGDVDGHRDRNRVYRLLVVRERSAGTRRGDNEQGKPREEDERRERRELRAPSRRFRGEARCRGEPYPRAPAAPQQPPGGKAERQQQKKHQWSRKSHVYVISSPP